MLPGQFKLRGLVMGPGTPYGIVGVEGLGLPTIRSSDIDVDGGVHAARDVKAGRTVTLRIDVAAEPGAAMAAALGALADAWDNDDADAELRWQVDGIANERRLTGRPRRFEWTWDYAADMGLVRGAVAQFTATDTTIRDAVTGAAVRL